ncbi:hypothetical protein QUF75_02930 [Desulfococcaceae bacterium HSG7]|nr:hypothetical protein [Desulfococcaceae bacterium HSG9]MDM8553669.1 hypothetical protein [Desulfococcaceae bacterium HSG7]
MAANNLKFNIQGPQAQTVAQELAAMIDQTFDHSAQITKPPLAKTTDNTKADPVAIAALVIAIPSAVLAVVDLVQRPKKKSKADHVIDFAQRQHSQNPQTGITITMPNGVSMNLDQMDSNTLIDLACQLSKDQG